MEKATFSGTAHKGYMLDCKGMIKRIIITETSFSCRFSLHKASCQGSIALARTAVAGAAPPSCLLHHGEAVAGEAGAFSMLSPLAVTPPLPLPSAPVTLPSSPARGEEEVVIRAGCRAAFVEGLLRNKVLAHVYSGLVLL